MINFYNVVDAATGVDVFGHDFYTAENAAREIRDSNLVGTFDVVVADTKALVFTITNRKKVRA